ncbi:YciI family protein [Rugamonas apoptosis]|uniref:YCII-related domain-containing protein n=1 Tax=Rugamonas apoptosis TaxID=2758570 RepID=A0A7W2FBY6_9BURK|nr:YciI family protein [Rugamonas apoptosis]MBA5688933.1 hypothetical protein [Rugamonas apoptosis]
MLFFVTLNNRRPPEDIEAQQASHRDWLIANARAGRIALAGPMEPCTGGLIMAHCADRGELDLMMADDPFVIHGSVEVQVLCGVVA